MSVLQSYGAIEGLRVYPLATVMSADKVTCNVQEQSSALIAEET